MEVHVAKGLLWSPIHILEVLAKRFLDFLREMMLAEPLLELNTMAVDQCANIATTARDSRRSGRAHHVILQVLGSAIKRSAMHSCGITA